MSAKPNPKAPMERYIAKIDQFATLLREPIFRELAEASEQLQAARCSGCQEPIRGRINLITLGLRCTWQYPRAGNVLTGEDALAVAIACDTCVDAHRTMLEAVELDGDTVRYHPIETLAAASGVMQ